MNEKSAPEVFLRKVFPRPPRIMDVRAFWGVRPSKSWKKKTFCRGYAARTSTKKTSVWKTSGCFFSPSLVTAHASHKTTSLRKNKVAQKSDRGNSQSRSKSTYFPTYFENFPETCFWATFGLLDFFGEFWSCGSRGPTQLFPILYTVWHSRRANCWFKSITVSKLPRVCTRLIGLHSASVVSGTVLPDPSWRGFCAPWNP